MDIHINELKLEDGFAKVPLRSLSFRSIDQEFILVKTKDTFGSEEKNHLYYCFIKPYAGLFFRLIGVGDELDNTITVDEDISVPSDLEYSAVQDAVVSKIVENGDLISNQLIVNLTFDYYHNNEEYKELLKTRDITWIDENRISGNPDCVVLKINDTEQKLKLLRCEGRCLIAESSDGIQYTVTPERIVTQKQRQAAVKM